MNIFDLILVLIMLAVIAVVAFVCGMAAELYSMHKQRPDLYEAWRAYSMRRDT